MSTSREIPSWEVLLGTAERLLPLVLAEFVGPGRAHPDSPVWRQAVARADTLLRTLGEDPLRVLGSSLEAARPAGPVDAAELRDALRALQEHLDAPLPSADGPAARAAARRALAASVVPPAVCGPVRDDRQARLLATLGLALLRVAREQERAWVARLDGLVADLLLVMAAVPPAAAADGSGRLAELMEEADELLCVTAGERAWADPWLRNAVSADGEELAVPVGDGALDDLLSPPATGRCRPVRPRPRPGRGRAAHHRRPG